MVSRKVFALARLDVTEVVRSRWPAFIFGFYLFLTLIFVGIGGRESQIVGFTGMGKVLIAVSNAIIIVLPLLSLLISSQVINSSRENGILELLFSHPFSRGEYFISVTFVRYLALFLPIFFLFPLFFGLSLLFPQHSAFPWKFMSLSLLLSAVLAWCFVGIGLLLSVWIRKSSRVVVYSLLIWIVAVALMDLGVIGLMLRWKLKPAVIFLLSAVNPVELVRIALVNLTFPTLHSLGPVGFFITNKLGSGTVLTLAILWPVVVGFTAWILAFLRFKSDDLI